VIYEARFAFIAFFFLCWSIVALFPWTLAAILSHGRGALIALPLALAAAWAAGVLVPLLGWRDAAGFFASLLTALLAASLASLAGLRIARHLDALRVPAADRPRLRRRAERRPAAKP
jgi:hypothetical protein